MYHIYKMFRIGMENIDKISILKKDMSHILKSVS